jgi:hypothetical protein
MCDGPRVKAQIEYTARQFTTVRQTEVYINDQPIDVIVGGR